MAKEHCTGREWVGSGVDRLLSDFGTSGNVWGGGGAGRLIGPPVVAVVSGLVDLGLLLDGGVLATLSSATLWRRGDGLISNVPLNLTPSHLTEVHAAQKKGTNQYQQNDQQTTSSSRELCNGSPSNVHLMRGRAIY